MSPRAVSWAETQQAGILETGFSLPPEQMDIARKVGVARPEKIRIPFVDKLPLPQDQELDTAALQTGLLGPKMAGLTLFYVFSYASMLPVIAI